MQNKQRSDRLVTLLYTEIREGRIEAVRLNETFLSPKHVRRRNGDGTYQRRLRDLLILNTPQVQDWFRRTDQALTPARARPVQVKVTQEAVESGALSFAALADATRVQMRASQLRGKVLGQSNRRARVPGRSFRERQHARR